MSAELQARANVFLKRSIPDSIKYVPDSIAERLIATYAKQGCLPDDSDADELLELASMESTAMAGQLRDPVGTEYFRENSAILDAILAERS